MKVGLTVLLLLAACSPPAVDQDAGARLERAAFAAGLVHDPTAGEVAGLYARDSDRVCIVAAGDAYRIGASIDYGSGQRCSARGSAVWRGNALRVDFGGGCAFGARFDSGRIVFPGRLPAGCDRLCTDRASLTALAADLQSDSRAEASALRDPRGQALCSS